MPQQSKRFYEFGPFRLDVAQRILLREGQHIPLTLKAYETLLVLVENSGQILDKTYLLNQIWPDAFIEEATLAKNISTLRKVLAESDSTQEYIETIPKRGYRFVAEVKEAVRDEAGLALQEAPHRLLVAEEGTPAIANSLPLAAELEGRELGKVLNGKPIPPIREPIKASLPAQAVSRISEVYQHKQAKVFRAMALLLFLAGTVFCVYWLINQRQAKLASRAGAPEQKMERQRPTNLGDLTAAAISPDGKYLAYAKREGGHQSLWLRQVAIASNVQITPPAQANFRGLVFSPDGNYLYYVNDSSLYQTPTLGGTTRKLIANVAGRVTFSPDGQQLAFVREDPAQGETLILRANADGSGEQRIATRKQPLLINENSAAWSPNGEVIAFASLNIDAKGNYNSVVALRVADGNETTITSQRWRYIESMAWLSDGSGVMMTARDRASAGGSPLQAWQLSYPDGEARKITNDFRSYRNASLTADSRTLLVTQDEELSNLWVVEAEGKKHPKQIMVKFGQSCWCGANDMYWTPDGKLLYASAASGNKDIWLTELERHNHKQLTFDSEPDIYPVSSPDGRYIVFTSLRAGTAHIWRIDHGGANSKQLTNGGPDLYPDCSPDSKWVVYSSSIADKTTLWKISIDGGTPIQITKEYSDFPAISPDGKLIACYYQDNLPDAPAKIAVIPFEGGAPVKTFDLPVSRVRWTADGRALTYIANHEGVSNLWNQPLAGGPPQQLTNFQAETIFSFAWSRDGKQLALVRGVVNKDVVLINNFR